MSANGDAIHKEGDIVGKRKDSWHGEPVWDDSMTPSQQKHQMTQSNLQLGECAGLRSTQDEEPAKSHRRRTRRDDVRYTDSEHEIWRLLVLRTSALIEHLGRWLHPSFIEGFERLIRDWSHIPQLQDLNATLGHFGWRTVLVDGYVRPDIYAGLIARNIFPVARGIRRRRHIDFSPMPDFAHDVLGHLPMLVNRDHRCFLQRIGLEMATAQASALDREHYLATRVAAELRCKNACPPQELKAAEERVERAERVLAASPSRLTRLSRLYLWSIEFGLFEHPQGFLAYGAGLLSAPAEIQLLCAGEASVETLSVNALHQDIFFSDFQGRYFAASDYQHLHRVLSLAELPEPRRRVETRGKA